MFMIEEWRIEYRVEYFFISVSREIYICFVYDSYINFGQYSFISCFQS